MRNSAQRTLLPQFLKASSTTTTSTAQQGLIGVDYFPHSSQIPNTSSSHQIFEYLISKEDPPVSDAAESYLINHSDLKPIMRSKLLDWLVEVSHEYSLKRITTQLCCIFVDKYLSSTSDFPVESLQLLGITSLVVASKLEEIYPPAVAEFAVTTDGLCSPEDIIAMEKMLLQVVSWNLFPMTYFHWTEFMLFNVFHHNAASNDHQLSQNFRDKRIFQCREKRSSLEIKLLCDTNDLIDIAILDIQITNFTQGCVAAAGTSLSLSLSIIFSQITHTHTHTTTTTTTTTALWVSSQQLNKSENEIKIQKAVVREIERITTQISQNDFESCVRWIQTELIRCDRNSIRRQGTRASRTSYKIYTLQSFNESALDFIQVLFDDVEEIDDSEDEDGEEEETGEEEEEEEQDEKEIETITTPSLTPISSVGEVGFTLLGHGVTLQDTDTRALRRARSESLTSHVSPILSSADATSKVTKFSIDQEKKLKRSFDTIVSSENLDPVEIGRKKKHRRIVDLQEENGVASEGEEVSFFSNETIA
jgi:hypothetical protein